MRWRPRALSIVGALLAWSASLVPSLLPRPWLLQGGISAIAIFSGYLTGGLAGRIADPITTRVGRAPSRSIGIGALVIAGALLVWGVVLHGLWRSDLRRLMDIDTTVTVYLAAALGTGAVLGYLLLIAGRLLQRTWRRALRLLAKRMSPAVATAVALASMAVATVVVFDVLVAGRLVGALSDAYWDATLSYDEDVSRPHLGTLSGGPGSLIAWSGMGLQGRAFVASARTRGDLEGFHDRPAKDPIRVYAGLGSARTVDDRAQLALEELDRAGGFDRAAIVVIAPTGTGWVDPYAIDPLEFIFNGDTAAVAIQYSHLPSWVLLVGNQDLAIASSRALFDAISQRVDAMPEDDRPLLLLYGESLGSFALEAMFTDLDDVRDRTDGVLWVGPSRSNRLWHDLMGQRSEDSPEWRPVVEAGEAVRFGSGGKAFSSVPGPWRRPRVAYLQHASDPITWLSTDLIFERPEWLDPPRGPDVSRWMPHVPGVTFLQILTDLVVGTDAPVGHGHRFGAAHAEAWALITPPDTWSPADTERLREVIEDDLGGPEDER